MDSFAGGTFSRVRCLQLTDHDQSRIVDSDDRFRAFQSPITHETYRHIPSTYIFTTKDQAFKHEYQLKTVQRAGITVTKTLETGHSPFLSRPDEVKDFIVSFAAGLDA